jgi:entericidin B
MNWCSNFRRGMVSAALSLSVFLGAATLLTGCNTTAGAGEDVSAAGHAVTNSAEKVKSGL